MVSRPAQASIHEKASRTAVSEYQATHLANRFAISLEEARSFVQRFGVERRKLERAVAGELQGSMPQRVRQE